jgi:isocitrate/isopropylmalate dehydrogenase
MLDFLGAREAAARINKAVDSIPAGRDMSTTEVGDAIAERL